MRSGKPARYRIAPHPIGCRGKTFGRAPCRIEGRDREWCPPRKTTPRCLLARKRWTIRPRRMLPVPPSRGLETSTRVATVRPARTSGEASAARRCRKRASTRRRNSTRCRRRDRSPRSRATIGAPVRDGTEDVAPCRVVERRPARDLVEAAQAADAKIACRIDAAHADARRLNRRRHRVGVGYESLVGHRVRRTHALASSARATRELVGRSRKPEM